MSRKMLLKSGFILKLLLIIKWKISQGVRRGLRNKITVQRSFMEERELTQRSFQGEMKEIEEYRS